MRCKRRRKGCAPKWRGSQETLEVFGRSDEGDVGQRSFEGWTFTSTRTRQDGLETKSTSGGMMVMMMIIDGTVVEHWSRTQATRALSTALCECCAVVKGAAE